MVLEIVDPTSTEIEHLASVDVQFSGTHIGGGIYLATNHNPDTDDRIREAIPQRSLNGEAEAHNATEIDYVVAAGADPNSYREDTNGDGTPDFPFAGFDTSLFHGDRLTSTGEFYDGPAASMLIANDPNDLSGSVTITGYPSAANSLDGTDGTLHQTFGTLSTGGYTEQTVGADAGGYFTIDDAEAVGGMSGGGTFLDFDPNGDGALETYLIATTSRTGTIDLPGPNDPTIVQSTSLSPQYANLAAAIESLTGLDARTADDFARMTLLSAQTLGSSLTTVQGQFFNEDIYGGINADTLLGAGGDDYIFGADGADSIDGGTGTDTIDGGSGSDTLSGGAGADWFAGSGLGGGSTDVVTDFEATGGDVIDLSSFFATLDDVVAATTDQGDGSILISLPIGSGGGAVQVLNTTIADLSTTNVNVVCFTAGTLIATINGLRPVQDLTVGDRVITMDNGYQEIRWIGSNRVLPAGLSANPKLVPIRIQAGALGGGMPEQDLLVSQQHRVLVRSQIAKRMFGTNEVLIPANKLLAIDGIDIALDTEATGVEYWHFLFDAHQVVWSNGAPTESLFTGPEALKSVSPEAREEIFTLFPEIALPGYVASSGRYIPERGKLMKELVQRHLKNHKPLA
jgi:Ca2+-binding RTX toxin-like protein